MKESEQLACARAARAVRQIMSRRFYVCGGIIYIPNAFMQNFYAIPSLSVCVSPPIPFFTRNLSAVDGYLSVLVISQRGLEEEQPRLVHTMNE